VDTKIQTRNNRRNNISETFFLNISQSVQTTLVADVHIVGQFLIEEPTLNKISEIPSKGLEQFPKRKDRTEN
jgi:hypothetical protein